MPDRLAERAPERELPAHVTTPLLQLMAQRALDADYAHVAARRTAGGAPAGSARPRRTAAAVLAVFGVLVATAAVQTSRNSAVSEAGRETLIGQIQERRTTLAKVFGWAFAGWGLGLYWWAGILYAYQVYKLVRSTEPLAARRA